MSKHLKKYNEKAVYIFNIPLRESGVKASIEICANSKLEAARIAKIWAGGRDHNRIMRARFWDDSVEGYVYDGLTPNPKDANGLPVFDYSESYY